MGGDLTVIIKEADGTVRTFAVPYSAVPMALRPGVSRWAITDGQVRGLGVDYAKLVASRVGLRLEFRPFNDWDAVTNGVPGERVPFDLLVGQQYNRLPERFAYLAPYVVSGYVLVARKGDLRILGEDSLAHARIAVERVSRAYTANVQKHFPEATMMFADEGHEALELVASGRADAYIGPSARTRWLLTERERDDLALLAPLPNLDTIQASLAVPRGDAMLAELLRKGQASISDGELKSLQSRWGFNSDLDTAIPHGTKLTEADRKWLASLGTLRVGYEADRYPYSFTNKEGELDGLAAGYVAIIERELGLRLRMVPAGDLDELQRRVAAKEVDLLAAAMPADYDPASMVFTRAYEHFPEVIVTRINGPLIVSPEDLRDRRVAVREEAGLLSNLKMLLPRTVLVPVVSNEAGLRLVEKGDVSAYIGTLPAIDALIRDRYAATLRVAAPAGLDQDIAFGVSRDRERLAGLINRVLAGINSNQQQDMRSRWLRADYQYGAPWVWVVTGLVVTSLVMLVIGIAYKRMRDAESRARKTEQRLVDTNENLPGVVMRLHLDGQGKLSYEYIGGATLRIFGVTNEDVLSGFARPLDVALDEDIPLVNEAFRRNVDSKLADAVEFRIGRNGATRWIRALGGDLKPAEQGGYFWSVYCIDVTTTKEQERALLEAKTTAEAAVAAKSAFLAMMSHEIRTPMAGVLGLVELLSATPLNAEQSHMVGMTQDSAVALLQILDDILDFSRMEAEKLELEPRPFDLRLLADSTVGTFAARALEKSLYLYQVVDWRLAGEYLGDANRIRQIINNLISNALKFTASGHVELRIELLNEEPGGHRLRFSVIDTGIGISPDHLNRLFQPFIQAEASTSRRFGGTGLGLSISRRLARMMGGDVQLHSEVQEGTQATFDVILPVLKSTSIVPGIEGKRALICTRQGMLERELANALSAMGCSVIELDVEDVTDFTRDDGDVYFVDASLVEQRVLISDMPTIHVVSHSGSRGYYVEDGRTMLCGSPLLWRSTVDACRSALSIAWPSTTTQAHPLHGEKLLRILVAEDHPINRAVIERQLDLLGFTCTVVEDGLKAWEALDQSHFDLLITDCHMPVLDGYALTHRIRDAEEREGKGAHLPIVALSASALPEQIEKCRRAGMDDFLAKPVQLEELRQKISRMVGGTAESTEAAEVANTDPLAYLVSTFGSPAQVEVLLKGLLDAGRADIRKLDAAIVANDLNAQQDIVHRIAGSLQLINLHLLPTKSGATVGERRDAIAANLSHIEVLLEALKKRA